MTHRPCRAAVLGLLSALAIASASSGKTQAQGVRFGAPPAELVLDVIEDLPESQRDRLLVAAKNVFPVFIFLPGTLGSQLTKAVDNGPSQLIWGRLRLGVDLSYDEKDRVSAELLERYGLPVGSLDVYESAIAIIKKLNLSYGSDHGIYAYDWRQSNRRTARQLTDWICGKRVEWKLNDRPVVFLAHSMGGLVLKQWVKNELATATCPGDGGKVSDWLRIKKIVFGGTPHYGSPKALSAFADNFYLYFDPSKVWARVVGSLDSGLLAKSINSYGATFPSAYQLLPVTNAECFPRTPELPIVMRRGDGENAANLDVFDTKTWSQYAWPTNLPTNLQSESDRSQFKNVTLAAHLTEAQKFLCDLAQFDIDKQFSVSRVIGDKHRTICAVTMPGQPGGKPSYAICAAGGDGTVPTWIAGEFNRADPKTHVLVSTEHSSLFAAPEFHSFLESYQKSLHREWQEQLVGVVGADGIADLYAKTKYVVPSAPDQAGAGVAAETVQRTIAKLGIEPRSVYRIAKASGKSERADGLRVYADLGQNDPKTDPWALNNAAHIYLGKRNFVAAKALAMRAIALADSLNAPEARAIKNVASLTAGIAAQKLGEPKVESEMLRIALENGNRKALRYLNP